MNIVISVANRVATPPSNAAIVCGNSDYTLTFEFDDEWATETTKIARFVWFSRNKAYSEEIPFEGNTVAVPILSNTNAVHVGVYAGNLRTTTPAKIVCEPSILCYGQDANADPSDIALIKGQIAELVKALSSINADPEAIKNAVTEYLAKNPPKVTETDPTVPAWAKAEKKPTYTAAEVGALSKNELNSAVNTALAEAKNSGKFDGTDGRDGADGQPGKDGAPGADGKDYVLTEADKAEIAEMAAELVDVPDSGGNVDQVILKSPDGSAWNITVSNNGVITATKVGGGVTPDEPSEPETGEGLETYTIFVPQNVSDEWKITGAYGTLNMSTAEFLELFYDGFVSTSPDGVTVTKQSIGKDESGQYDMWEYDFCPTNYSRTILLSSGMHSYELSASFGLANFIGHLYTDTGNDAFDYIRNNVRVKVIPVVNPWGFNQYPKKYGNINGVNPNRNFDLDGQWASFPVYTPSENEWNVKGEYPFSEAEAHNLARWAEANWNAEFWIDCHTGEGYSDKDLWVYYASDAALLDRINGAISKIEEWFKETYGTDCVTTRTIDSEGSIRLFWAEKVGGIPGMTLEQAPHRTTFGTSASNEAADISNYSTNISTFVQEFLLGKYRNTDTVAIQSVSLADVTISGNELSKTVTANISPANTTQNKFEWVSSNETVVKVYGGTSKAVVVRVGTGTATLTCKNRYDNAVVASCSVNVLEYIGDDSDADMLFAIGGLSISDSTESENTARLRSAEYYPYSYRKPDGVYASIEGMNSSNGKVTPNKARVSTDYIHVIGGAPIAVECLDGYLIKAFYYDINKVYINNPLGTLATSSASGTVPSGASYMRILFKKSDNSEFTLDELTATQIVIDGVEGTLKAPEVCLTIDLRECPYQMVVYCYDSDRNYLGAGAGPDNTDAYKFYAEGSSSLTYTNGAEFWLRRMLQEYALVSEEVAYLRFMLRKENDSTITAIEPGVITINGVRYAIKLA